MIKIATLAGCAIGDALGNPFEMKSAISPAIVQWDGQFKAGGTFWYGNPGQYTDDTLMSIALSKSLLQSNGFDPEDVAKEYLAWYDTKNTRGIGTTTATAIVNLKTGSPWTKSGLTRADAAGNGSAMRASPIGLVYRKNLNKLIEVAMVDASITHNSLEPKMGSIAIALAVALLANRDCTPQSVAWEINNILVDSVVRSKIERAQYWLEQGTDLKTIAGEALADIGTAGYVPETVGAAFYCLGATSSFKDAVIMAVKGGGDTDTTAAIVGAMAGTWYGLEGIPQEYHSVENFDILNELTQELINIDI